MGQRYVQHPERAPALCARRPERLRFIGFRRRHLEAVGQFDQRPDMVKRYPACRTQEPVVPDFHEPCGQNMLEKPPQELHHVEIQGPPAIAPGFFVPDEDRAVFDLDDPAVRQSHAENIGREIFEASLTASHGLRVHVPGGLPHFAGNLIEQPSLLHLVPELRPEDRRQSLHRHVEAGARRLPCLIPGRERPAHDDVVNMGMILERPAPGVQDPEEARQLAAHELGIKGELFHSSRRSRKQSGVRRPLIAPDEPAQLLGHGKGDHEVMTRQAAVELFFEPGAHFG